MSVSGNKFLCSVLVAPVKNEHGEIIMFIINYEDITDAPNRVIPLPDIRTLRNSKPAANSNYAKSTSISSSQMFCKKFSLNFTFNLSCVKIEANSFVCFIEDLT